MTSSLRDLKVFTTYPHRCSYLEDEDAVTLFVDPRTEISQGLYSQLSSLGFRRSGGHLYRPHCDSCRACIAARVPVAPFKPNRSQRRCLKRNEDLRVQVLRDIDNDRCYDLYARYIHARHRDGDMFPPEREQYRSFLSNEWGLTQYYGFYAETTLLAVAVTDRLDDGLSAIYTFFDPDYAHRSLGSYAILWQLRHALQRQLPYLYLGYWIRNCQKMAYKTQYRPLELYVNGRWIDLL